MNKLGKNKFLTGMGVLFLVGAAAWVLLVLPANSAASEQAAKINKAVTKVRNDFGDLPGEQNVKAWTEHAEGLKKRYATSLQKMLERDQNLGQWFEGITDDSTFAAFMTPYDDMRVNLEKELLEKGVDLGAPAEKDGQTVETRTPGFNWLTNKEITRADTHEKEMQAKEMLQKRFNICRAIVNAVTADVEKNSPRPRRLLDVTFLEKFPYLSVSAVGVPPDAKSYLIPIDLKRYAGYTGPGSGSFQELLLPENGDRPAAAETEGKSSDAPAAPVKPEPRLGKTLTFGFAVVMDYHHVPNLIRNLIEPSTGQELNLSLVGLNIFVNDPNKREIVETVTIPAGSGPEVREGLKKKGEELTANCPPAPVHVYVTCQVFDIDPAAVPAFLKP